MPHVEGVRHEFLDLNGVRIHVAEAGPPDAQPVLLLHGWPQHWFMWRDVIGDLKSDFRLLIPDLRGFGWSDAPGHGYDTGTFAADQLALLDALEIDRAHVIGHDWGGWTTLFICMSSPERFERAVVCNSPHPWPRIRPQLIAQAWRTWYTLANAAPWLGARLHRRGSWVKWILTWGSANGTFSEAELEEFADSFREPGRAAMAVHLYRHYLKQFARLGREVPGTAPRLTVPTLLLFGERDPLVTRHLLPGFERRADAGRLEFVPDAGHFIVDEKPRLVAARAREHFAAG